MVSCSLIHTMDQCGLWVVKTCEYVLIFVLIYREVFKARHKKTKKVVALKKVLMENEKEGVSSKEDVFCNVNCITYRYRKYMPWKYVQLLLIIILLLIMI